MGWRVKREGGQRVKTNLTNHRSLVRGKNYKSQPEWWVSQYEHGEVSWLSASVIQNVKELFRVKPGEMNCMTDKGKISMKPAVAVWETFFFLLNTELRAHCIAFVSLAKVQAWHSCESGLAVWDILADTQPTCESKNSSKCSTWVILCLIKMCGSEVSLLPPDWTCL